MEHERELPTIGDVLNAANRLRGRVHRTPVMTSESLDALTNKRIYFKGEHLQRAGAFKARGATYAVMSLPDELAARGVATHSSGNHGAALAWAAKERGIPAHVVMPENAKASKIAAVRAYGGSITFCAPTQEARERTLGDIVAITQANFIHPYDDPQVIAGQGTAALELIEEVPDLDLILVPVGGGGLCSGTCLVGRHAGVLVMGGEPRGADDAARSLATGQRQPIRDPQTCADGLLTSLSDRTFTILQRDLLEIRTVSEDAIRTAMRLVWERLKQVIEPSSAVPLAVLLEDPPPHQRVGIILSGGNVDLDAVLSPTQPRESIR